MSYAYRNGMPSCYDSADTMSQGIDGATSHDKDATVMGSETLSSPTDSSGGTKDPNVIDKVKSFSKSAVKAEVKKAAVEGIVKGGIALAGLL